jgi:hypothetical protein
MHASIRRKIHLAALGAALVSAWAGSMGVARAGDAPKAAAAPTRAQLEAELARIASTQKALAATPTDIAAHAARLGNDPERIFRFVRDEVALDPYAGVLRGARGTLVARAGNAWDRALLLAALLRAAGKEARLARGAPDDATLDALLARAKAPRPARRDVDEIREDLARAAGFEPASPSFTAHVRESADATAAARAEPEAAFTAIFARDEALLSEHARRSPVPIASAAERWAADARAALADHVWVELREGATFRPLDPSLPAGAAPCAAKETLENPPPEAFHRVKVRVEAEWREKRVLATEELLAVSAPAADLARLPVLLTFRAAGSGQYAPVLILGGTERVGKAGSLEDARGRELTALRLVVEVTSPARPPAIATRDLVDRVGLAARAEGRAADAKLAPLARLGSDPAVAAGIISIAVVTGPIDLRALSVEALRVTGNLLARMVAAQGGAKASDDGGADALAGLAALNLSYHALRADLASKVLPRGALEWAPAPRVTLLELKPIPAKPVAGGGPFASPLGNVGGAQPAAAGFRIDYDLALLPSAILVPESGAAPGLGIAVGVLDHAAERVFMERYVGKPPCKDCDDRPAASVSEVFEAAARGGVPLVLLDPHARDEAARLEIPEDARARVRAQLANGFVVLAPAKAIPVGGSPAFGYWKLDPERGTALDETDAGCHDDLVEYGNADTVISSRTGEPFLERYAWCLAALGARAFFALNGRLHLTEAGELFYDGIILGACMSRVK